MGRMVDIESVMRNVISPAKNILSKSKQLKLTARDSLFVLNILNNLLPPNNKLLAAAFDLPK
jgi:uncharacterized protein (DUF1778 family)